MYYAEFCDLARAYVGPFETAEECDRHAQFVKARGDSAAYFGPIMKHELPRGAFILSPQEDRDYVPEQ